MYLIFLFMCWKLVLTQCIVVTVLLCDAAKISESPQRSDAFVPSATVAANEALSVTTAPTESVIGSSIGMLPASKLSVDIAPKSFEVIVAKLNVTMPASTPLIEVTSGDGKRTEDKFGVSVNF